MPRRKSEPPDTERLVSRAQAEADAWNAANEVGCDVNVTRDNGEVLHTITRASAGVVGGTAVIWVVGIAGCYAHAGDLEREVCHVVDVTVDWSPTFTSYRRPPIGCALPASLAIDRLLAVSQPPATRKA